MNDWLLEYDCDNEIYTLPATNREAIERVIGMFDGQQTFYCCLSNTADESCLWCVGEPERRLIEGRVFAGKSVHHFILRRRCGVNASSGPIRHGMDPGDQINIGSSEVFTPSEALSVFLDYFDKREISTDYEPVTGVRLFGANTFGT